MPLTNLKAVDQSVKPLAALSQLEELAIAIWKNLLDYQGSLKTQHAHGSLLTLSFPLNLNVRRVAKIRGSCLRREVSVVLCKECDDKRLERHVEEFEDVAAKAA